MLATALKQFCVVLHLVALQHYVYSQEIQYCEEFKMYYNQDPSKPVTIPKTPAGASAVPIPNDETYCFDENNYPPVYKCLKDANWQDTSGVKCDHSTTTTITDTLTKEIMNVVNVEDAMKTVINLIETSGANVMTYDIHLMAMLFCLESDSNLYNNFVPFKTAQGIMQLENGVLKNSQVVLNSTDMILSCYNKHLVNIIEGLSNKYQLLDSATFSIFLIDNDVVVVEVDSKSAPRVYKTAIDIPERFLENSDIEVITSLEEFDRSDRIFITTFFNNNLFKRILDGETIILTRLVNIAISPLSTTSGTIQIYFKEIKQRSPDENRVCIFWRYGFDENLISIYGDWIIDSEAKTIQDQLYMCTITKPGYYAIGISDSFSSTPTTTTPTTATTTTTTTTSTTTTTTTTPTTTTITSNINTTTTTPTTTTIITTTTSTSTTTTTTTTPTTTTITSTISTVPPSWCPSTKYCYPNDICLTFDATEPGYTRLPRPDTPCLSLDYYPPTLTCFENSTWSEISGECEADIDTQTTTKLIDKLNDPNSNSVDKLSTVFDIVVDDNYDIFPYDVYLMTELIISSDDVFNSIDLLKTKFDVVSNMTRIDSDVLIEAQYNLDSCYDILHDLDYSLKQINEKPFSYNSKSIGIHKIEAGNNILQIDNDLSLDSSNINIDDTVNEFINNPNFDILIVINETLTSPDGTVITIFSDNTFFIDEENSLITSRVISFSPESVLKRATIGIDIYLKQIDINIKINQKCVSWRERTEFAEGSWIYDIPTEVLDNNVYKCTINSLNSYYSLASIAPPKDCDKDIIEISGVQLTFPQTPAGSWSIPKEYCVDSNNQPARRKCLEDSKWGEVIGTCESEIVPSEITQELWNLQNNDNVTESLQILDKISRDDNSSSFKAIDVHLMAKVLDKFATKVVDSDTFMNVIDNIMEINDVVLKESQKDLNSTDTVLFSLDNFLLNSYNSSDNLTRDNLFARQIQIDDNICGFLVLKSHSVIPLLNNSNINMTEIILNTNNLEFALVIKSSRRSSSDVSGYISGFYNSFLFNNENDTDGNIFDNIFSILIPNAEIDIYFKLDTNQSNNDDVICSYWNYGKDAQNLPIYGSWSSESQAEYQGENIFKCSFNHTTHFGLLLPNSIEDNAFLSFITIFGTILSIFALLIIIICAVMFKNWRKEPRNKVVLNLALSQFFLIILIFISDSINSGSFCIFIGVILHYIVVANFFWMLCISYFEYLRGYKTDIENSKEDRIWFIRANCFSWGVPWVFIIFVLGSNYRTYDKSDENKNELCYPKEMYFQLAILLPMISTMTLNLVFYGLIIRKSTVSINYLLTQIRLRKAKTEQNPAEARSNTQAKDKVNVIKKSIFLMFFVLGFTWIFGLVGAFSADAIVSNVFSYLFCMVVVFQGFVIFVHYVYGTKSFQTTWNTATHKFSTSCTCSRKQKSVPRNSNTSSISES